jgi:hypothetical protein
MQPQQAIPQQHQQHQQHQHQLVDGNNSSLFGSVTPSGSPSQLSEMFYLQLNGLNERERADRVSREGGA